MQWKKGCLGALGITIIAFFVAFRLIDRFDLVYVHMYAHPFVLIFEYAFRAFIASVVAGIIGWIVIAWLLGKKEAAEDSS